MSNITPPMRVTTMRVTTMRVTTMRYGIIWSAAWWASILSAAAGANWLAIIPAVIVVAWSLWDDASQWWRYLILVALGTAAEAILISTAVLGYPNSSLGLVAPPWIIGLWALWAVGCDRCLLPSTGKVITGLITVGGAPLAYYGGASFEVVMLSETALALIAGVYLIASLLAIALIPRRSSQPPESSQSVAVGAT